MFRTNLCVALFFLFAISISIPSNISAEYLEEIKDDPVQSLFSEAVLQSHLSEKAAPWWVQKEEAKRNKCKSTCTKHSKGTRAYVNLCDDKEVCPKQRKSVAFYASQQCKEWGKLLSQSGKSTVELLPEGKQVKHQPVKGSWLSCAIFCKTSTNAWYTPRRELDRLNVDSFFPDGVWCHRDIDPETHVVRNYFCQNNLCLPEVLGSESESVNEV